MTVLLPTLAETLWPQSSAGAARLARQGALALIAVIALWLSAKVQVPLYPVPITLQTLVVLVIGVAYGPALGAASCALYLGIGALGLPVFAGAWSEGGGIEHLYGPTAGYLAGFVVASWLVGRLARLGWDRKLLTAGLAMILGNVVIYALGVSWLAVQIGLAKALEFGLLPFLYGDFLKIALGTALLPATWYLLGRKRG